MEQELTLGDIYDDLQERLAQARTRALMGERQSALETLRGASLEYLRWREMLAGTPGFHALEHAYTTTLAQLCADSEQAQSAERASAMPTAQRGKRTKRAA